MQWRQFEQGNMPQNETFLLCLGDDVFFAKTAGKKIITKSCYSDIEMIKDIGLAARGGDVEVFLHNLAKRKVTPLWAHFHKPEVI